MKNQLCFLLLLLFSTMIWATGHPENPNFGGQIPNFLIIDNSDTNADSSALNELSISAEIKFETVSWRDLKSINIGDYDAVILPSRMYKKDINGVSAYIDKILFSVENEGTGLIALNNYLAFNDDIVPLAWTQGNLIKVMPLHSDEIPVLPFGKVLSEIDAELKTPDFNTLYPEKTDFESFILKSLECTESDDLHSFFKNYQKAIKHRLNSFGWFESDPSESWETVISGKTSDGSMKSILIEKQFGKGRIILTSQFIDVDVVVTKDERVINYYLSLLDRVARKDTES